jgi:aminoglycoside phosphotransferase (APT) family kinase protein
MEYLDGRILEDPGLCAVQPQERLLLWKAAVHTMAKFHLVDYKKIGLQSYGKAGGFYDRQLTMWKQLSPIQAKVIDVASKVPVGDVPHFEELTNYFSNKELQPKDRVTLTHGDYKLDNVVFHKTEPRIIGILDWEVSTVGHPLSDLANLLSPFYTVNLGLSYASPEFIPGATPGLPTADMVIDWYAEVVGWDPRPELDWAVAFSMFRSSALCQGIAARAATRQATSKEARRYADAFKPLGEFAWQMVMKRQGIGKSPQTKL